MIPCIVYIQSISNWAQPLNIDARYNANSHVNIMSSIERPLEFNATNGPSLIRLTAKADSRVMGPESWRVDTEKGAPFVAWLRPICLDPVCVWRVRRVKEQLNSWVVWRAESKPSNICLRMMLILYT